MISPAWALALACLGAKGFGPPRPRWEPDRLRAYLSLYLDDEKRPDMLALEDLFPGFPKARVKSGILSDIAGNPGYLRPADPAFPFAPPLSLQEMSNYATFFRKCSLRSDPLPEPGPVIRQARALAHADSVETVLPVVVSLMAYDSLPSDFWRRPSRDVLPGEAVALRIASAREGVVAGRTKLLFRQDLCMTNMPRGIRSVTVSHGDWKDTRDFPCEVEIPACDPANLIYLEFTAEDGSRFRTFLDPAG
jgi:hypothetical protein